MATFTDRGNVLKRNPSITRRPVRYRMRSPGRRAGHPGPRKKAGSMSLHLERRGREAEEPPSSVTAWCCPWRRWKERTGGREGSVCECADLYVTPDENELGTQPLLLGTNGEKPSGISVRVSPEDWENRVWNKNVKQSLVVSEVGCDHYNDKLLFSYDTHFYLALEIAVLKRGAVWTPKGVPIPQLSTFIK